MSNPAAGNVATVPLHKLVVGKSYRLLKKVNELAYNAGELNGVYKAMLADLYARSHKLIHKENIMPSGLDPIYELKFEKRPGDEVNAYEHHFNSNVLPRTYKTRFAEEPLTGGKRKTRKQKRKTRKH